MRRGWFYIFPTLAIGFVLLECKQPTPLRPQFVYVANFYSNLVSAYSIGSNGALTPVPGSPFGEDAAVGPVSVALDPSAKFAYVANFAGNNISAFSIGSNGVLAPLPGLPFAGGQTPFSIVVDPTAKFAYVANRFGSNILAYSIGSNGALTPHSRFALCSGIRALFSGSGPYGQVRLRGKH